MGPHECALSYEDEQLTRKSIEPAILESKMKEGAFMTANEVPTESAAASYDLRVVLEG